MSNDIGAVRRIAQELFSEIGFSRTVILTGPAAGSSKMTRFMTDAGARTVSIDLKAVSSNIRDRLYSYKQTLEQPSESLWSQLNMIDPECTALVYAGSFIAVASVCGRRVVGARLPDHFEAERKDRQQALLGLDGEIITLANGLRHLSPPCVVQGVPEDGIAMATSHTYLIRRTVDKNGVAQVLNALKRDCNRAVVTTFTCGIPCTFYGFVTPTTIVDFGPVEALVYWNSETWRIHAPGILRPLQIAESVLASARVSVHNSVRQLQQKINYVGAFGVDGVLNNKGYAIHEVNPRVCAGFSFLDRLAPEAAPLAAIDLVLRENPTSSQSLVPSLLNLAIALQRHQVPAFQLWEIPITNVPHIPRGITESEWVRQVRVLASGGHIPICELEDTQDENTSTI